MSNNRITPFVKRMRTNGGTIYTFSSAVEDIGLNINERNNVVKISHFALLNIPKINEPDDDPNYVENRFNVLAIPSAFEYWKTQGFIKDGRIIVAESFQNYALNFESNLLNQDNYDSTLSRTVSERVFWKWMKETGAIRWANPSNGYWTEVQDADGSVGYNTVVKYFGPVSAGNVRSDSFGTYNETYVLVPTSHGQMEPFYEQIEDNNYYQGMIIGSLGGNILGREGWTKPHPDGLSFLGYYDYVDSSAKVWDAGSYTMTVNGVPGGWYSAEGIHPVAQNTYMTDAPIDISAGDYDVSIMYSGGDVVKFKRSKVDCVSLVLDLNKLKSIYGNPLDIMSYDDLATGLYAVNDTFEFNAVMIYYSIYNSVQDTILATNLLGVLFLDAPSGNTQVIGNNAPGIVLPSLEKIQSGPNGFGTSYALRLNIKSDNMVDDTAAIIVDAATSDQLQAENWNEAFFELEKAVNILTENNSVLQYISGQYLQVQNAQTQMQNELNQLEFTVNDIGRDIGGTAGALTMFSDGDDPLIESSIFMANGKIGFFNTEPTWPVQIDASLKTKDIYIEKSIRDASGDILIGYGSPLQIGSTTKLREMTLNTGNSLPAIVIDTSNNITFNGTISTSVGIFGPFVKEASLGPQFIWTLGRLFVNASSGGDVTQAYVDGSLNNIRASYIPDISLNHTQFIWGKTTPGILDVSVTGSGGVSQTYVDTQIGFRDISIAYLNANKQAVGNYATTLFVNSALLDYATNASIGSSDLVHTPALSNYVLRAGDQISGDLVIYGDLSLPTASTDSAINFNGCHANVRNTSQMTCTFSETDMPGWSQTVTPKGNKLFISACMPVYPLVANQTFRMMIYVENVQQAALSHFVQSSVTSVSLLKIVDVSAGVPVIVKLRWSGTNAIQYRGGGQDGFGELNIVDLY